MSDTTPRKCPACGSADCLFMQPSDHTFGQYDDPMVDCLSRQLADANAAYDRLARVASTVDKRAKAAEAIVDKLPGLVRDLCERREWSPCQFDNEGDCGNWPSCLPDCALRQLRELAGIVPQEDGGTDKQSPIVAQEKPDEAEH